MFQAEKFRERQQELKLTNTELARRAGVSRPLIIQMRRGDVERMRMETLNKALAVLDLRLPDLLNEFPQPQTLAQAHQIAS